ncbi:MAG: TRAP transporter small permease [Pseudomonadota bacterium]|nr:TRAP transporter small permease [Pseudomonadota bacterium]
MRFRLSPLYTLGGYAAALCLSVIGAMIAFQVIGRLLDKLLVTLGGGGLNLSIPGLSEISGFLLVGASFLGLAYTYVRGGHIRVTLVTGHLPPRVRVFVELWCLTVALALCLYWGWHVIVLVQDSIAFGEVSYGMVPVPLWIPQSAMLAGIALLTLALLEAWLSTAHVAITRPSTFRIDAHGHE